MPNVAMEENYQRSIPGIALFVVFIVVGLLYVGWQFYWISFDLKHPFYFAGYGGYPDVINPVTWDRWVFTLIVIVLIGFAVVAIVRPLGKPLRIVAGSFFLVHAFICIVSILFAITVGYYNVSSISIIMTILDLLLGIPLILGYNSKLAFFLPFREHDFETQTTRTEHV